MILLNPVRSCYNNLEIRSKIIEVSFTWQESETWKWERDGGRIIKKYIQYGKVTKHAWRFAWIIRITRKTEWGNRWKESKNYRMNIIRFFNI